MLVVFSFFSVTNLSLADEKLKPEVKASTNSVEIYFNLIGDQFEVLKGDKLIKKGKVNKPIINSLTTVNRDKIVLNNLDSNTPQRFKVKAIKDNKEIEGVIIETSTLRSEKDKEPIKNSPLKDSHLTTIIKKNEVNLTWAGVPDDDNVYEIYRNGKLVNTVKGNTYVDNTVFPNKKYLYEIVGKTRISNDEIKQKEKKLRENKISYNKKDEEDLFYVSNRVYKNVDTSGEYSTAAAPPSGYGHLLRYQIFIPDPKAANLSASAYKWPFFKGDNRYKYDWYSNKYRTRVDVYALFNYNPAKVVIRKSVNPTVAYDWHMREAKRQPADLSNVKLTASGGGSDSGGRYANIGVSHAVCDPLVEPKSGCPAVDYWYKAKVYENGNVSAIGSHDQAPSHELWMINYPGDFDVPLHTFWNKGLIRLISIYPSVNWSYSY